MLWHSHADGFQTGSRELRNVFVFRQDQRQWAWEKRIYQFLSNWRNCTGDRGELAQFSDVGNQRIVGGTAFGFEDFSDGVFVEDIGAQTIHSLRRERDDIAVGNITRG